MRRSDCTYFSENAPVCDDGECGCFECMERIAKLRKKREKASDDIKSVQIIATTNDGKHIMAVSDEKPLIYFIVSCCKFVKLKDELFEQCSLKEIMEE